MSTIRDPGSLEGIGGPVGCRASGQLPCETRLASAHGPVLLEREESPMPRSHLQHPMLAPLALVSRGRRHFR